MLTQEVSHRVSNQVYEVYNKMKVKGDFNIDVYMATAIEVESTLRHIRDRISEVLE